MRRSVVRRIFPLCLFLLHACGEREDPADTTSQHILDFDTATVRLATSRDTVPLLLELASSEDQQRLGLMERRQLPERAGMLFVYDSTQPPDAGFWMFRTRIPLDIAFLDSLGIVRSIRAMVPCTATLAAGCPTYAPDTPYHYALEVNAGALRRWGVTIGSRLLVGELAGGRRDTTSAQRSR
jgi:uncharacterized membrane protein (UPF0127 family)